MTDYAWSGTLRINTLSPIYSSYGLSLKGGTGNRRMKMKNGEWERGIFKIGNLKKRESLKWGIFSVKWGWLAYTTSTVRDICTFAVLCSLTRPFCRFTRVHEGHLMLCYKEELKVELSRLTVLWQIFIGHRSAWFPLLSAFRFVEFDTSVVCHVFMYCLGSFLLQDMLLSLHVFAFEGQNMKFTVNVFAYLHWNSLGQTRGF